MAKYQDISYFEMIFNFYEVVRMGINRFSSESCERMHVIPRFLISVLALFIALTLTIQANAKDTYATLDLSELTDGLLRCEKMSSCKFLCASAYLYCSFKRKDVTPEECAQIANKCLKSAKTQMRVKK